MPALSRLDLVHVRLPLRKPIRHASHERASSDSLIVRATLFGGAVGYGEGVPRSYVTNETLATALQALSTFDAAGAWGCPNNLVDAIDRLSGMSLPTIEADPRGMFGNSARAALELAILDAYTRSVGESVGTAIRLACRSPHLLTPGPSRVRYSGAITAETPVREIVSAIKMHLNRFHQVKIKVGVDGQDDAARLARIRRILGRNVDIRLDANESWSPEDLVERVQPLLKFHPTSLEQPVPHEQVDTLADLRPHLGLPVMLDESLCGIPDGRRAIERGTADLFNVRISKCGGLFPTLRLIEMADRAGLGYQLGCHPGESGLLSAAGRHLAANIAGFRYVEGSYDRHVLSKNLTKEDPTFGFRGWAKPIDGPGLGVTVDPAALESLTIDRREIRYD